MRIMCLYPSLISGWASYREHGNNESSYMDHGIAMISAVLKMAGHETFSMDLRSFRHWEHFEEVLKRPSFDMTLVSFFSANERFARQAVEIVKRNYPNKIIVGGGVHLSVTKTQEYPNIDAIVHGEGEPHILGIVDSVQHGEPLKKVYDLEPVTDLNSLPYVDRALFNARMEQTSPLLAGLPEPFITIVAGRGCWGKCTFCAPSRNLISGDKIRIRSVDNLLGELIQIKKELGSIGSIMIHDDLLGNKKWMGEFVEKWRMNLPHIPWWCQLRADTIIKMEEFIPELANIGMTYVSIGLESGSQRMLDFLQKGTTVEENIKAAKILHDCGINIFGNYITCLPTETKEDLDGTEKMLAEIRPAFHSASVYTSYPGSYLYNWIQENDYWVTPEEHYSMTRYPFERKIKGVNYEAVWARGAEWRRLYTSELRTPKKLTKMSAYIKSAHIRDEYDPAEHPVASVILVTYNRPEKLKVAIQSIINQTLQNWELIVLDYTENPQVNENVRLWAIQDKRIRWIWHSKNINNISYCWNEGLDLSRGKYWCTLDDDNTKYPKFLENMTSYLESHPENDTVVCPCDINSDGGRSTLFRKPATFADILNMNHIDSGQCVHRKTLLEKIGCFDERLLSYDDWDFMLRIHYLNGQSGSAFGWLAGDPLCSYTKHTEQRTYTAEIQATYAHNVPFVRAKTRLEKIKIKIINAVRNVTESQKQFAENTTEALKSLYCDIVERDADIVVLNGILYQFTQEEMAKIRSENPKSQIVALLIEDPQALHMNIDYIKHLDWVATNDINAYDFYLQNITDEEKKKHVLYWNNLYISNKLLDFVRSYDPQKEYDICMIGYAYQSRADFMKELLPLLTGKSVVLIGDKWKKIIPEIDKVKKFDTMNEIETARTAMKSKIILLKHRNDPNDFKILKPGSVNRGYIEAAYRSTVLIDSDRPYDSFAPNTIIRYTDAADCAKKIENALKNYEFSANTRSRLFVKATEQFTYRQILLKIINCVRSVRYNAKLS